MLLIGLSDSVAKLPTGGLGPQWALGRGLVMNSLGIESGSNHNRDQKRHGHPQDASKEYNSLPLRKCPDFSHEVDPPDKKRKRDQKDEDILHVVQPIDEWVIPSYYNIMI